VSIESVSFIIVRCCFYKKREKERDQVKYAPRKCHKKRRKKKKKLRMREGATPLSFLVHTCASK
jgi:hypothetical protein